MRAPAVAREEPSLAALLDTARALIVAAWDRGERPESLVVHPALARAVGEAAARDAGAGHTVRVLGLRLVASDAVPLDRPRVV